ncbi:hypothetical protein HD554DRAFT_875076 [Boletus coccyginus]|nr:hypothetical protein HD554DRAFT_875076 [Boletus coccyginus]
MLTLVIILCLEGLGPHVGANSHSIFMLLPTIFFHHVLFWLYRIDNAASTSTEYYNIYIDPCVMTYEHESVLGRMITEAQWYYAADLSLYHTCMTTIAPCFRIASTHEDLVALMPCEDQGNTKIVPTLTRLSPLHVPPNPPHPAT